MDEMRRTAQMAEAQEIGEHGCDYGCIVDEQNPKPSTGGIWMIKMMDVRREQISCWMNEMRRIAAVPDRGLTRTWPHISFSLSTRVLY